MLLPLLLLGIAFAVALVRVARGPTLADRAVAAEMCFVIVVSAVAVLATASAHFLDVVVIGALFQFLATVSLGRLLERKGGRS